jgi:hypothetical protein
MNQMYDNCTYILQLHGQASESEINALAPLLLAVERSGPGDTWFSVRTDQSGLIGLMRHLHGLGFVFLSVQRLNPDPVE